MNAATEQGASNHIFDFDLFVIGGGSGGVRAGRIAAGEYGARVAMAEESRMGGTCVIRGCVPKKLMIFAASQPAAAAEARGYGWAEADTGRFDWPAFRDAFSHIILPASLLGYFSLAYISRMTRSFMLEQLSAEYITTARVKGLSEARVIWGHAFRNSLIPVATGFGSILGVLFAGSIIIESIFEIPGMGRLSWDALIGRDYAVFLALLALTSVLQLIGNLLSDFCYLLIDPRIHFGQS